MRRLVLALLLAAPAAALVLVGADAPGRALLALGLPSTAAKVLEDSAWRGAALYEAGRWREAEEAFGSAPRNAYNRANALARQGRFAQALTAYDEALAFDPADEDAAANREIVAALAAGGEARRGGTAGGDATKRIHGPRSASELSDARSSGSGLVGTIQSKSTGAQGRGAAPQSGVSDAAAPDAQSGASGTAGAAGGQGASGGMMADITKMMAARDLSARRTLNAHAVQPTRDWLDALDDDPGAWLKLRIRAEQARRKAQGPQEGGDDD